MTQLKNTIDLFIKTIHSDLLTKIKDIDFNVEKNQLKSKELIIWENKLNIREENLNIKQIDMDQFKRVSFITSMNKQLNNKNNIIKKLRRKIKALTSKLNTNNIDTASIISFCSDKDESETKKLNNNIIEVKEHIDIDIDIDIHPVIELDKQVDVKVDEKVDEQQVDEQKVDVKMDEQQVDVKMDEQQVDVKVDEQQVDEQQVDEQKVDVKVDVKVDEQQVDVKVDEQQVDIQVDEQQVDEQQVDEKVDEQQVDIQVDENKNNEHERNENKISGDELKEDFEDFEIDIDNKTYLFTLDKNGNNIFRKKLKSGKYSKKIYGTYIEDSDGELEIDWK